MSNQSNSVPCAYCGDPADPTKGLDHVFARSFFRSIGLAPQNPIKIPSCLLCNNDKSKLETYTPLITNLASGQELDDRLTKSVSHISSLQKKLFSDASPTLLQRDSGIYLPMVKIKYDWDSAVKLYDYIAMGIVYEYCGKIPVKTRFPNRIIAGMPRSSNESIKQTISQGFAVDNQRYNGKVQFAVVAIESKALVYFQILNATFLTNKNEICDIIAVSMSNNGDDQASTG